jgi:hypothetical protein
MNYPLYPLRGILYGSEQVRANQNQEGDRVQNVRNGVSSVEKTTLKEKVPKML